MKPDVVVHTCNPMIQEVETEGFRVGGQSRLHSKMLSQKKLFRYYYYLIKCLSSH
jgi:hypothetical protein